jgi:VWFA-related protein
VVVDDTGTPVRGLKASDFLLRDRGKSQEVVTFDEVSHDRGGPAAAALPASVKRDVSDNGDAQSGRLIVMVLDDLHIYRGRTDRARSIARKVLADLGPQSSMAVLFTSGRHSTLVSGDPAVLGAAIETLEGRKGWRRPHQASDAQRAPGMDPQGDPLSQLAQVSVAQRTDLGEFFDNMAQYYTLRDASRILAGGDARRKAFVFVSEGIGKELTGLFFAMSPPGQVPEGGEGYARGNLEALNTVRPIGYHDAALVDMMEAMRRSNVATYAIDPRGRVESGDLLRECTPPPPGFAGADACSAGMTDWVSPVRQAQRGLSIMSEESGGFAVTNTDDFTGGIAKIVADLDHYYLLGFYPSDRKGSEYRRLDVLVPDHPGWRLRFRHGYMASTPPKPPPNAAAMTALASGVLPRGDLRMRLAAVPAAAATAGLTRVALALEVTAPVSALQDPDGKLRDTLKYEILVVDERKKRVRSLGGLEGRLTLSPSRGAEMPANVSYQVEESIDLAPGRFELRVSATSERLGKGGSVYLDLEVADLRATPLALGGLAVAYADGPHVPVAPPSGRRPASALPLSPTLDRVFSKADALRVYVEAVSASPRLAASLDVVDASGRAVLTVKPSAAPGNPVRIEDVVPLRHLQSGPYTLRATIDDGVRTATRELGFAVR